MFRGSVKSTGYPLHSPVSPSLPLPGVTVCHHISTGLYAIRTLPVLSRSAKQLLLQTHRKPSSAERKPWATYGSASTLTEVTVRYWRTSVNFHYTTESHPWRRQTSVTAETASNRLSTVSISLNVIHRLVLVTGQGGAWIEMCVS
jgi:hypothetical protein